MTTLPVSLPSSTRVNNGWLAVTLQRFRRECEELRRVEGAASGRRLGCDGDISSGRRQAVPYANCCLRRAQRSWRNG
jgi:hypothetical protein